MLYNADHESAARLVIKAAPKKSHPRQKEVGGLIDLGRGLHGVEVEWPETPGDPEARIELAVHADRLQALGDQLGEWLALWLGGHEEWVADALEALGCIQV